MKKDNKLFIGIDLDNVVLDLHGYIKFILLYKKGSSEEEIIKAFSRWDLLDTPNVSRQGILKLINSMYINDLDRLERVLRDKERFPDNNYGKYICTNGITVSKADSIYLEILSRMYRLKSSSPSWFSIEVLKPEGFISIMREFVVPGRREPVFITTRAPIAANIGFYRCLSIVKGIFRFNFKAMRVISLPRDGDKAKTLKKLGVSIMVDDSPIEIINGVKEGLRVFGIKKPYNRDIPLNISNKVDWVKDLSEVTEILRDEAYDNYFGRK